MCHTNIMLLIVSCTSLRLIIVTCYPTSLLCSPLLRSLPWQYEIYEPSPITNTTTLRAMLISCSCCCVSKPTSVDNPKQKTGLWILIHHNRRNNSLPTPWKLLLVAYGIAAAVILFAAQTSPPSSSVLLHVRQWPFTPYTLPSPSYPPFDCCFSTVPEIDGYQSSNMVAARRTTPWS